MSSLKLNTAEFLKAAQSQPVIDVRSPSEYAAGHIPGAVNIPLFNDREREIVGTAYKKEGREKAILRGLELAGPGMSARLSAALAASRDGNLLVHCWRGGMRSESMAWLFSLAGIRSQILEGGYKAYRNHILEGLSARRKMIVLGGFTGSSKTHILREIGRRGPQVIDLEELANHRGSAFGALGQPPQPSTEHFANLLYEKWEKLDPDMPLWIEDESRNIGTVFMPEVFYNNMQESPTIILVMDIKTRMPRLLREYSVYPPESLRASITRISKRLGGDNTKEATRAVDEGDFAKAIEITLLYYDKAYRFGIERKKTDKIIYLNTDTDDIETNASLVLEAAQKITR
jgi:tRNA 2-selenouridine synthase